MAGEPRSNIWPKRVIIVGGGCAGIAAAWELSKLPDCEIHVYEKSHRLGGKGASSRDGKGRILEHGLHVWLGFYENAFRMMRECYEVVERGTPSLGRYSLVHKSFKDAFAPEPNIGVAHPNLHGDLIAWSTLFPPVPGLPGDDIDEDSNPFTLASYLLRCVVLLKTLMVSVVEPLEGHAPGKPRPDDRSLSDEILNFDFSAGSTGSTRLLIDRVATVLRSGTLTSAAVLLQGVSALEAWLQTIDQAPQVADSALQLAQAVAAQIRKALNDVASIDSTLRMKTEVIDIVLTIVIGLFRDRVLFDADGFDAINQYDYREWLRQNGATDAALKSRFLTGIYDLAFAYREGDRKRPALAAGVALRGALRMFLTYRGAMFWRMRSGMGEAVFAPLYAVLSEGRTIAHAGGTRRASPVTFHFQQELTDLATGVDSARISSLTFRGPKNEGSPLDSFGCWLETPRNPSAYVEEQTLPTSNVGIIVAMGVDDLRTLVQKPGRDLPGCWTTMFDEVKTVATRSAQVWLNRDFASLGWHRAPGLVTALGQQFETFADMTHTLATERAWREAEKSEPREEKTDPDTVQAVAYFCGTLSQSEIGGAGETRGKLRKSILGPLNNTMTSIGWSWSDTDVSYSYERSNCEGSDRYTLSLPGSPADRISPLDRNFENATIAGDWTACGLDVGCIEAAVMSGQLAAHAISGRPDLASIIGYDHP